MQFIKDLYQEAKGVFQKYKDENVLGMIIFYGPVFKNPDLMIIGGNPGGTEEKVQEAPEKVHDYIVRDYPMARNMKKIFKGHHDKLFKSVKFNRIFFRSRNMKTFYKNPNWENLVEFSNKKSLEIIQKLKPKLIVAEGFGTFNFFNTDKKDSVLLRGIGKKLMLWGHHNNFELIGLTHPSGTRGLSDEEMIEMNKVINDAFDPAVLFVDNEDHYQAYLAVEELHRGKFKNERPKYADRYNVAKSWFEKIIPILESNGKVRLRHVGNQGLVKQAIKMDELKYTLDQIYDQLDNQNRDIEADPSLKKSFEVLMNMFIHSSQSELRLK